MGGAVHSPFAMPSMAPSVVYREMSFTCSAFSAMVLMIPMVTAALPSVSIGAMCTIDSCMPGMTVSASW